MPAIAVTGATGFIGRALCHRAAEDGHNVIAIGRNWGILDCLPSSIDRRCVADFADVVELTRQLRGAELIVHLADQADRGVAESSTASASLMSSVVAAGSAAGATDIIFASSIYASLSERGSSTVYGRRKRDAERILLGSHSLRCIILRLPPVYGPGSKGSISVLSGAIGKSLPMPFGSAKAPRDYLFIDNLIELILAIVSSPTDVRELARNRYFEPSDGEAIGTGRLVELIAETVRRKARLLPIPPFILKSIAHAVGRRAQVEAAFEPLITMGNEDLSSIFGWFPRQKMPQSLGFLRHESGH